MKKLLFTSLVAVVASSAFATVYTGTGGSFTDGGNLSFTAPGISVFNVNVLADISSVNSVTFRGLTHTFVGDLTFVLSNGLGSSTILNRTGATSPTSFGTANDFNGDYTFAVGGAVINSVVTGGVINPGTYEPSTNALPGYSATNYSALAGAGSAGSWTLTVTDWSNGDLGSFSSFDVDVTDAVPEPATMVILGGAALAAAARRRKK